MKSSSNLRAHRVFAAIAAIFTTYAHAYLDTNNNGLSDLWEKQHNNGQLFSPTNSEHQPTADPDQDGWNNLTEAAAGTDPSLANPPEGIVATTLLPSATTGAYTLTWPTQIGKRYQLQASTDMESWFAVGDAIIAENTCQCMGINPFQPGSPIPPKLFWHVLIDDIDSDTDGLTNNEEHQLATNPNAPDSDGDGLPDGWEMNHNLNPNDSTDAAQLFLGSGLSNLQAYAAGVQANPNATVADIDGDDVENSDDAAPDDGTIDWKRTAEPMFAVVELPVDEADYPNFLDLSERGTVLLESGPNSTPNAQNTRLIVDTALIPHVCIRNSHPPIGSPIGTFVSYANALIGEKLLGTRLIQMAGYEGGVAEDCLWYPLENSYTIHPGSESYYHDDILDDREIFRIQKNTWPPSEKLKTHLGVLAGSEHHSTYANIEKNGNIVTNDGYWRYDPTSNTYGGRIPFAALSSAGSATITQETQQPPPSQTATSHTWNLLPDPNGIQISKDDADFQQSTVKPKTSQHLIGLTTQGWIATNSEIWANGKWRPLKDLLGGTTPQQATLLGIRDTGLGVARIQHQTGPAKMALVVPVDLISDLNNDGQITPADHSLRDTAMSSGATDEIKDKGTEFMFHNDTLSNGLWDREDSDPGKPEDADDDDAETILINIGALPAQTQVWLEHPASDGLKYYLDRKCTQQIPLSSSQRYVVGGSVSWPSDNKLFIRAEGILPYLEGDPQLEGDLVLKIKVSANGQEVEALKMKLTVVKEFGAKKYFYAANDYILENNVETFIRDKTFPYNSSTPTAKLRVCALRSQATQMLPYEAYQPNHDFWVSSGSPGAGFETTNRIAVGLEEVMELDNSLTLLINGNLCDFSNGMSALEATALSVLGTPKMTDKCHGNIKELNSAISPASNTHFDANTNASGTSMKGHRFAGPDPIPGTSPPVPGGKHLAQYENGQFVFGPGHAASEIVADSDTGVATNKTQIGGLATNYEDPARDSRANQMIGYFRGYSEVDSMIFTATDMVDPSGVSGYGAMIYTAAKSSGVADLNGATHITGTLKPIELLLLDGGTSTSLAYKNANGNIMSVVSQSKNNGIPYYINTFLQFKSSKPRP